MQSFELKSFIPFIGPSKNDDKSMRSTIYDKDKRSLEEITKSLEEITKSITFNDPTDNTPII